MASAISAPVNKLIVGSVEEKFFQLFPGSELGIGKFWRP